jgi:hypothetical protein
MTEAGSFGLIAADPLESAIVIRPSALFDLIAAVQKLRETENSERKTLEVVLRENGASDIELPTSVWVSLQTEASEKGLTLGGALAQLVLRAHKEARAPKPAQPARRAAQTSKRQLKVAS